MGEQSKRLLVARLPPVQNYHLWNELLLEGLDSIQSHAHVVRQCGPVRPAKELQKPETIAPPLFVQRILGDELPIGRPWGSECSIGLIRFS